MRPRGSALEIVLAAYVGAYGVAWLAPGDAFAASSSYRVMAMTAPEWAWGAGWLAIAALWVFSMARGALIGRRLAALFSTAALMWVAITFVISNPATAGGWGLAVLAGGAAWARWTLR